MEYIEIFFIFWFLVWELSNIRNPRWADAFSSGLKSKDADKAREAAIQGMFLVLFLLLYLAMCVGWALSPDIAIRSAGATLLALSLLGVAIGQNHRTSLYKRADAIISSGLLAVIGYRTIVGGMYG